MIKHILSSLLTICLGIILFTIPTFSQQNPVSSGSKNNNPASNSTSEQAPSVKAESPQSKEISICGQVQSVSTSMHSLTVQCYDQGSDKQKSLEIITNKDTKLKNVSSLADLKNNDWTCITYIASDAKNIARSIAAGKDEGLSGTSAGISTK